MAEQRRAYLCCRASVSFWLASSIVVFFYFATFSSLLFTEGEEEEEKEENFNARKIVRLIYFKLFITKKKK